MSRRPYRRAVKRSWWLGRRRYVIYMVRELSSLFILLYCAALVAGLTQLAAGEAAWERFLGAVTSGAGTAFQRLCLGFAVLHSVTWFALAPKALPTLAGLPRATMTRAVIAAHYAAWAALSILIVLAAGG
jgi:fumarate reductase subunit C